jgi:hypothetical protein
MDTPRTQDLQITRLIGVIDNLQLVVSQLLATNREPTQLITEIHDKTAANLIPTPTPNDVQKSREIRAA